MIKKIFRGSAKNGNAAQAVSSSTEYRRFKTLSFAQQAWVCWGLLFRALILFFAYLVCFSAIDALQKAILMRMDLNIDDISGVAEHARLIDITILALLGVVFFYLYIRWIFAAKFSRFRLILTEDK